MATPVDLTPQQLTTSNLLLLFFIMAKQFESVDNELTAVSRDRNIATARADTLVDNWGTLLEVRFSSIFTLEKYRTILEGVVRSRRLAPTKAALREMVLAYAPSSEIEIHDLFNEGNKFVGPDQDTFFTWNDTRAGNRWNNPNFVYQPGRLQRLLGFDSFGTQVEVISLRDGTEVEFLQFVPEAFEFIRPAHTFVALVYEQEVLLPL